MPGVSAGRGFYGTGDVTMAQQQDQAKREHILATVEAKGVGFINL
jgi:hypothetical protein